jgi:hypothetical protein
MVVRESLKGIRDAKVEDVGSKAKASRSAIISSGKTKISMSDSVTAAERISNSRVEFMKDS